jgi:hypothetical protein
MNYKLIYESNNRLDIEEFKNKLFELFDGSKEQKRVIKILLSVGLPGESPSLSTDQANLFFETVYNDRELLDLYWAALQIYPLVSIKKLWNIVKSADPNSGIWDDEYYDLKIGSGNSK